MSKNITTAKTTAPSVQDWVLLIALVVCGGSSFAAIRAALEGAPPSVVAAGRLWVATALLWAYARGTGRRLPPLRDRAGRPSTAWLFAAAIGVTGYTIPMTLFPFAQQSVSSLLAGIYMAFMPIVTVVLAATFADEPLTRRKLLGFGIGTLGVAYLIGPDAVTHLFNDSVIAQLALLVATTGYAVASVILRRAPTADIPARSFAVAFMLMGAICSTPLAIADLLAAPTAVSTG